MGAARQWLEGELERDLGAQAFIYESRVRPIREGERNWSIAASQAFLGLAVVATAVIGLVIAVDQRPGVLAAYVTLTTFALAICVLAVADLLRTYQRVSAEFGPGASVRATPWVGALGALRRAAGTGGATPSRNPTTTLAPRAAGRGEPRADAVDPGP